MTPYQQRRLFLASQLGPGDVAIIPTASEKYRNRDATYPFRADSYFYYLTGFEEPNSVLFLNHQGESVLFCQPKDLEKEIWDGYRLGPEDAPERLHVTRAFSIEEMDQIAPLFLSNHACIWYPFVNAQDIKERIAIWLEEIAKKARTGVRAPHTIKNVCAILDEMRLIKDAHEIEIMKRAGQISAAAHIKAMAFCAQALRENKEIKEYHLEAELLHEFRRHGSEYPAYTSIVAAGANACVLHYRADKAPILSGDLVLIDAGCELHGYASDITRTFPANGRFTGPQKDIYECVLQAQEAAVSATQAGRLFSDPHDASVRVLSEGLLSLGILNANEHGSVDDVIEHRKYAPFYMHRTSHWLGMDVHDCGSYTVPSTAADPGELTAWSLVDPKKPTGLATPKSRALEVGMVLTLEPGLYIRPTSGVAEKYWNIGVRIEDDALITPNGAELISRDVPVTVREIEHLMS
jgi:Xaa-Pro aminopeptidase